MTKRPRKPKAPPQEQRMPQGEIRDLMSAYKYKPPRRELDLDVPTEVERLATMERFDYERSRRKQAKRLGVRATALDSEVRRKRTTLGLNTDKPDDGQGRGVRFTDPLPWDEPVSGDTLATSLVRAVKLYVAAPDVIADVIALWILHSWLVDKFTMSPRLAMISPTKGCGKSTVLRLLHRLTRRPKRAGSISPAALFRAVEMLQPTFLLDETEKYIEHGGDLHALINEGHCKGASVMRVLGDNLELREFSIFGALALARNGNLPDDIEQRSIVVVMQRARREDGISELSEGKPEPALERLARMCARWSADNADAVANADPDMAIINRKRDNWRPLYAIASVIGGGWTERMIEATALLMPQQSEDDDGVVLLGDNQTIFTGNQTDRMFSGNICKTLHEMEGRKWAEWGKARKPITKNQLARLLGRFKITPVTIRIGDETAKGYYASQFTDAWKRYLTNYAPPPPPFQPSQRNNADGSGTSVLFNRNNGPVTDGGPTVTGPPAVTDGNDRYGSGVTVENSEKPLGPNDCYAVTDGKGDGGVCVQCGGPVDATERQRRINGREVWLHPECERFFRD